MVDLHCLVWGYLEVELLVLLSEWSFMSLDRREDRVSTWASLELTLT